MCKKVGDSKEEVLLDTRVSNKNLNGENKIESEVSSPGVEKSNKSHDSENREGFEPSEQVEMPEIPEIPEVSFSEEHKRGNIKFSDQIEFKQEWIVLIRFIKNILNLFVMFVKDFIFPLCNHLQQAIARSLRMPYSLFQVVQSFVDL